jgi:hypothetical protein
MHRPRTFRSTRALAAATALAALVATISATSATGQTNTATPTTERFYVHFGAVTSGHPTMKPGETITARSVVYDKIGGHRLGRTSELCIETVASPLTMQCSMTAIIGNNTFTMTGGFNPGTTPYRAALTGGTGRYAGAHGTLLAQTAQGAAENWAITYTK